MERKSSFLGQNKPLVTCMVQGERTDHVKRLIRTGIYDGADAFGVQLERILPEERTEEKIRDLIATAGGRPVYATDYRIAHNEGKSDEELADGMRFLLRCGATLIDVMGDLYGRAQYEITHDIAAIAKQKRFIQELHAGGAEVLMSSHTHTFMTAEEILALAKEHESRGADISKIVSAANSDEEELELFRASRLLKRELGIPFLLLCGGTHCERLRTVGPLFGSCMWLTVAEYDAFATSLQPLCRAVRRIADGFSAL